MRSRAMLAEKLVDTLNKCRAEVAGCKEQDRVEQARAGVENIRTKGFADEALRDQAVGAVRAAGKSALAAIDRDVVYYENMLTDAPDNEAANYITAVSQRSDLTDREVDAALKRYSGHQAHKAILAAAKRSGLDVFDPRTGVEHELDDLAALRESVAKTYVPDAMMDMTDGQAALDRAEYAAYAEGRGMDALGVFAGLGRIG